MKSMLCLAVLLCAWNAGAQLWKTDLDDALAVARSRNVPVLLFFSVADACDVCSRLDKEVFQSQEFTDFADRNLVLVKLDFQNPGGVLDDQERLLVVEKYNKDGFFPRVVLIDKSGKMIAAAPIYSEQSPRRYLSEIQKLCGR